MAIKGCWLKVRHPTAEAAEPARADLEDRTGYAAVYACEFCGGWHVTKARQDDFQRRGEG